MCEAEQIGKLKINLPSKQSRAVAATTVLSSTNVKCCDWTKMMRKNQSSITNNTIKTFWPDVMSAQTSGPGIKRKTKKKYLKKKRTYKESCECMSICVMEEVKRQTHSHTRRSLKRKNDDKCFDRDFIHPLTVRDERIQCSIRFISRSAIRLLL